MVATQIEFDPGWNAIVLRFRGNVTAVEMRTIEAKAEGLLAKLPRGFHLLTDLTGLEQMDLDCVPYLTRFMDRSLAAGVGTIVRVIPEPDKDIGFGLLSLTHYRGRVPIATVATEQEARAHIETYRAR